MPTLVGHWGRGGGVGDEVDIGDDELLVITTLDRIAHDDLYGYPAVVAEGGVDIKFDVLATEFKVPFIFKQQIYTFTLVGEDFLVVPVAAADQAGLRLLPDDVEHSRVVHFVEYRIDEVGAPGLENVGHGRPAVGGVHRCSDLVAKVSLG